MYTTYQQQQQRTPQACRHSNDVCNDFPGRKHGSTNHRPILGTPPLLAPTAADEITSSGPVRLQLYMYNETLVNRLLNILKPDPVDYSASTPLVWATAKEFEGKADKREKWYGTPYQASARFKSTMTCRLWSCHTKRFWRSRVW